MIAIGIDTRTARGVIVSTLAPRLAGTWPWGRIRDATRKY
jgi:hypothetical protein